MLPWTLDSEFFGSRCEDEPFHLVYREVMIAFPALWH